MHRSVKWWRKLFFHMFSLLLNNAYMLNKKLGVKPLVHDSFLEHIVQYLLNESMGNATTKVIRKRPAKTSTSCRFEGHHYPVHNSKMFRFKNWKQKMFSMQLQQKGIEGNRPCYFIEMEIDILSMRCV